MTKELAIRILRGDVLGTNEQMHEAVFMAIRALKTEPKHGRWVIKYGDGHTEPAITGGECSICGYVHTATNYCPNCGARMGERRTDE